MPDLLARDLGQIREVSHVLVAPRQMGRRHGDDLLVLSGIVLHDQDADRPDIDHASRHQRPGVADQHVDRVAVVRQRMRYEAVIPRIGHRRVEEPVDDERAGFLVHLIFDRLAADGHLDDDVDVVGR